MNPESVEMNDRLDFVFASVTRKIREPNVGSLITVFAAPSEGAAGMGFASVPVYAVYDDGATSAAMADIEKLLRKEIPIAIKKNLAR